MGQNGGVALPLLLPLPLHMGALHPFEQALTLVLAFGPFVLLGVVIAVRRRAEGEDPERGRAAEQPGQAGPEGTGASEPAQPAR